MNDRLVTRYRFLGRTLLAALIWSGVLLSVAGAGDVPATADPEALYQLGMRYGMGDPAQGIPPDFEQSRIWLEKAAAGGSLPALHALAWIYSQGRGVPRDPERAATLFMQAAAGGYAESQYLLGLAYAKGEGVPQDDAVSLKWIKRAADQGHPEANRLLDTLFRNGAASRREAP